MYRHGFPQCTDTVFPCLYKSKRLPYLPFDIEPVKMQDMCKSALTFIMMKAYKAFPWNWVSRICGAVLAIELPRPFNELSVWLFATYYNCKRSEAEFEYKEYSCVSDFFIRRLKPGLRPISNCNVVSPADGTLTFQGPVVDGQLQQVKGVRYDIKKFFGHLDGIPETALFQAVIYLGPSDYHRFHSPAHWTVQQRRHFSGTLYSVAPAYTHWMPGLFHTNERVCLMGTWHYGFFSMTAVGATNVGSIVLNFDKQLSTNNNAGQMFTEKLFAEDNEGVELKPGDEMGYFKFGSTIVLIFEAPTNFQWQKSIKDQVKVGGGLMM